jgi:microcin C transport system substrate-binding protein
MLKRLTQTFLISLCLATSAQIANAEDKVWRHGASAVGELKYQKGFAHFNYVNPDAPKGGELDLPASITFDTLNPALAKGDLGAALDPVARTGWLFETLLTTSEDEISSEYGLLAEEFSYPEDYSSVTYRLHPEAKWHDGMPVTPEDVIFSYESFIKYDPQRENYYKHVEKAEKTGPREVTFTFDEVGNQELPQIVGQLMVMPKHWWEGTDKDGNPRDISATTLEAPLGSGPYRISDVNPGSSITYERVDNYWGKNLNVNIGRYNIDKIKYNYFADRNVMFEAFKADEIDFWSENEAKRWATGYNFPAFNAGKVKREVLPNAYRSSGIMIGFMPNLRREKFQDMNVRKALNLAYDFEEQNRTLFFDAYQRINSFFFGSELASSGLPTGREREILEELRGEIPDSVFTNEYTNPIGGTPQNSRGNLREAVNLLKQAGYEIRSGKLINTQTNEQLTIELLLGSPIIEKVALPYAQALKKIGIDASVRVVDQSQYTNRVRSRDYDVIYSGWAQSLRPGNEQHSYWGSRSVDQNGSQNYMGVSNPAIDKLIGQIIFSKDRDELIAVTKAMDRVLLANHFIVPTYTLRASRIAYWDRFTHPTELPTYSIGFPDVWWSKSAN